MERNKSRTNGDVFVNPGECPATQIPAITTPDLPPEILETSGCRVFEILVGCCIYMPIFPYFVSWN